MGRGTGRQSLVQRLTLLGLGVLALALAASMVALLLITAYALRDQQLRLAEQAAELLADNLAPALAFDDARAADGALRSFAGRTDLQELQVWHAEGRAFGAWLAPGATARAWQGGMVRTEVGGSGLLLVRPVQLKGERMGWLVWREGFGALRQTQARLMVGGTLVLATALLGAWLLLRWQQRRALGPLISLSRLAERVALTQDYSERAPVVRRDEVGRLAERFNDLMRRIEIWHRDLNDQLQQAQHTGRQLRQQAHRDALTGMANRLAFEAELERVLAEAREAGGSAALLFIDLDGFKGVNDRHGHAAGDAMLVEVARRMGEVLRGDDLLCRLGGDEFALLMARAPQSSRVEHLATRLIEAVRQPLAWEGETLQVGASVGIAFSPQQGREPAQLLAAADAAMYAAKRAGKNTYRLAQGTGEAEAAP